MAVTFETVVTHNDDGTYSVSDFRFAEYLSRRLHPTLFPCPKCGGRLIEWSPAPYCVKCGHIITKEERNY